MTIRSSLLIAFLSLSAMTTGCNDDDSSSKADHGKPQKASHSDASSDADAAPSADLLPDGGVRLVEGECQVADAAAAPDSLQQLDCKSDYLALASQPADSELPGVYSVKVVLDTYDADHLYFQNSERFQIHYEFVSTHLSGGDFAIVPGLDSFNASEYYAPEADRRFFLGAVSYYEAVDAWTLEIAPYDTATGSMVERLFNAVKSHAYFGPRLTFHPTSENVADRVTPDLPDSIQTVNSDDLYGPAAYQPLTLGSAIGRLHFTLAANLEGDNPEYLNREDIVVLDEAPNDISVVAGLITQEFQTPLSHVNVLAQNRHTPNMGLRNAMKDPDLLPLDGKWVKLTVGGNDWSVEEVTEKEAQDYIAAHKPEPVELPKLDFSVTGLPNIEDVTVPKKDETLRDAIKRSVLAFGGKAAQYSVLAQTEGVPIRKAFAVPVYYYNQFMEENGLFDKLDTLLADKDFQSDPDVRDAALKDFRDEMKAAPVNQEFQDLLKAKMDEVLPGLSVRFRTSTNSEDLEGFPCAGCYESQTGDPNIDWDDVLKAVRKTWASIWLFRTFEERSYYGIDHKAVGMALLCHHNFPEEEANGVAVTANPFDEAGLEPAFYVNVQKGGDAEVVHPPAGVTSDQFLYYFYNANQPVTFIAHSSLIDDGEKVLTPKQTLELGNAMDAIHKKFSEAYGPKAGNKGWYAMDIEFKFDDEDSKDGLPHLLVKQARPYPGRGQAQIVDQSSD
ncbi:MAG TPA: PEP/pyruvate-binding domain-containing protein [Polyangiaceae bacterium]|jgi:hypothetical protein|nr:PEP/pyruvate-binding domain-containing protein [Polyangiaceae bacterium]